jgi:hypothetical protein
VGGKLNLERSHCLRILLLPPLFAVLSALSMLLAQPPESASESEQLSQAVVAVLEGAKEVG